MLLNKEGFLDSVEAKSARSGETHQLAAQNEMKNQKAHSAFGIREDYQPGAAFTEGKSGVGSSIITLMIRVCLKFNWNNVFLCMYDSV